MTIKLAQHAQLPVDMQWYLRQSLCNHFTCFQPTPKSTQFPFSSPSGDSVFAFELSVPLQVLASKPPTSCPYNPLPQKGSFILVYPLGASPLTHLQVGLPPGLPNPRGGFQTQLCHKTFTCPATQGVSKGRKYVCVDGALEQRRDRRCLFWRDIPIFKNMPMVSHSSSLFKLITKLETK